MMYRILYIEGSGDIAGGGQISFLKLLENIDRTLIEPILVCPFSGNLVSHVEEMGISVKILSMDSPKKNPIKFFGSVHKLRQLMRSMKVDLVHANTSRSTLYGGLAAKPLELPVIWHVRVIESEGWYDRFLSGLCHKLVVVSKAVEKRFNWLLSKNPEKVTVIHNGADIREFYPIISGDDVRSEFNLKPNVPVAGVVGNLLVWKGQEYFIRAASEVRKVIPSAMFLVVGDGECRHDLERSSEKLGIRDKVIFTGRRFDIPKLMAAMNVIVHSSITPEPFARVILEAMAMGKPVVAMNGGGVPEVIKDGVNGISIPPKNASLMARKIMELLSDRDKAKKMGQAARKCIEEHFSIEAIVKKIQKEYLQILK